MLRLTIFSIKSTRNENMLHILISATAVHRSNNRSLRVSVSDTVTIWRGVWETKVKIGLRALLLTSFKYSWSIHFILVLYERAKPHYPAQGYRDRSQNKVAVSLISSYYSNSKHKGAVKVIFILRHRSSGGLSHIYISLSELNQSSVFTI